MRTISLRFYCSSREIAKKVIEHLKLNFEGLGDIYQGLAPMKHDIFVSDEGYEVTHQVDCFDDENWKKALEMASSFMHASIVKANFPEMDASVCILSGTLYGDKITALEKQLFYNLTRFTSEVNAGMIVVRSNHASVILSLQEQIKQLSDQVASLLAVNASPRISILNAMRDICDHIDRPDIMETIPKIHPLH